MKTRKWKKRIDGVRQRYNYGTSPNSTPNTSLNNTPNYGTLDIDLLGSYSDQLDLSAFGGEEPDEKITTVEQRTSEAGTEYVQIMEKDGKVYFRSNWNTLPTRKKWNLTRFKTTKEMTDDYNLREYATLEQWVKIKEKIAELDAINSPRIQEGVNINMEMKELERKMVGGKITSLSEEDIKKYRELQAKRKEVSAFENTNVSHVKKLIFGSTAVSFEKKGKIITTKKPIEVLALSEKVRQELSPFTDKLEVAGSIRRKQTDKVADIDIVAIPKDKEKIKAKLEQLGKVTKSGNEKIEAFVEGVKVDVVFTKPENWGAALFYLTGPAGANIQRRKMAKELGMKLNQEGLFDRKTGKLIASRTEEDIYKALGKPYKEPKDRRSLPSFGAQPDYSKDIDYIQKRLNDIANSLRHNNEPVKNLYRHLSMNDKALYEALKDRGVRFNV